MPWQKPLLSESNNKKGSNMWQKPLMKGVKSVYETHILDYILSLATAKPIQTLLKSVDFTFYASFFAITTAFGTLLPWM